MLFLIRKILKKLENHLFQRWENPFIEGYSYLHASNGREGMAVHFLSSNQEDEARYHLSKMVDKISFNQKIGVESYRSLESKIYHLTEQQVYRAFRGWIPPGGGI